MSDRPSPTPHEGEAAPAGEILPPQRGETDSVVASVSYHDGPLPAAREFEAYERAVPGAGRWILDEAARAAEHARQMDREAMAMERRDALLHRLLPFGFVFMLLSASVLLGIFASPWAGGIGLVSAVSSIGLAYMRGTFNQRQPQEEKRNGDETA